MKNKSRNYLIKKLNQIRLYIERYEDWSKYYNLEREIRHELDRRNRAAIFKKYCEYGKNFMGNQFLSAAVYADRVIEDLNYFSDTDHWEIDSQYIKNNWGAVLVDFE